MTEPAAQSRHAFPRVPLFGTAAMMVLAVGAAFYGRMHGGGVEPPTAKVTAERILQFNDRPKGAVVVRLADSGQVLDVMTGQNGFLRGTLRGLARTRRAEGIGAAPPFRLTGYADGRLILLDPATGHDVELEAFGSANEAVFARLLTMAPIAQTASTEQGHL